MLRGAGSISERAGRHELTPDHLVLDCRLSTKKKAPRRRGAFDVVPAWAHLVLVMPLLVLFVMVPPWSEPGPEPPWSEGSAPLDALVLAPVVCDDDIDDPCFDLCDLACAAIGAAARPVCSIAVRTSLVVVMRGNS